MPYFSERSRWSRNSKARTRRALRICNEPGSWLGDRDRWIPGRVSRGKLVPQMTVHILFNGRSYCGLSILHQWPAGDTWIGFNDPELDALADCEACGVAFGGVVLMGCRVGDPHTRPIAGTTDRPCDDCSAPTMFDPSTL